MNISIFGLGYVGAVTAGCLTKQGHRVIGSDVLEKKINAFNQGESPIVEPGLDELLHSAAKEGLLSGTSSPAEAIAQSEVSIVCVGTPSLENGRINLAYVHQVSEQIATAVREKGKQHALIFRSTMLPGSTRVMVGDYFGELINEGLIRILYCPEFLREGSALADFISPSLVVAGTSDGQPLGDAALETLLGPAPQFLTWEGAEMTKYACNYLHAVKVAFANEIGRVGKAVGVDSRTVMEVVCQDTRLNISKYYMKPGNPFGGSCLPKDVSALASFARQEGITLPLLQSTLSSNQAHLDALLKLIEGTGCKNIAILGLAFKNNTDDLRGSPMVAVAETVIGEGKALKIYDPHLNLADVMGSNERVIRRTMPHLADLLCENVSEAIESAELIIVAQKCCSIDELESAVSPHQILLDVNGWPELATLDARYTGSCWN